MTGDRVNIKWNVSFCENTNKKSHKQRTQWRVSIRRPIIGRCLLFYRIIKTQFQFNQWRANNYIGHRYIGRCLPAILLSENNTLSRERKHNLSLLLLLFNFSSVYYFLQHTATVAYLVLR